MNSTGNIDRNNSYFEDNNQYIGNSFFSYNHYETQTQKNNIASTNMNENSVYTHSISQQDFNELFGIFDKTCSHCGKLQKLHYKFGKDTRCFRMSLQGGYDWQYYYNLFEANYNGYFYADFENGIMYIHMNYTETLDTANWKNFKSHCEGLFGITLERLQYFRNQHKKRVCKRDNGKKYNRTYRLKKKGILVNPY